MVYIYIYIYIDIYIFIYLFIYIIFIYHPRMIMCSECDMSGFKANSIYLYTMWHVFLPNGFRAVDLYKD